MIDQYSDAVLSRYYKPKYCGVMGDAENVGSGQVGTADSGEVVRVQIRVSEAGIIDKICFKAHGSCATIAATEWVCEHAQKRPLSDVEALSHEVIIKDLHLHRVKMHSALLAIDALEAAVADFQAKSW